ncbi:MAG: VWA domain-containing protein [Halieaceae bacterium]|jgi:Ca-activated chloride channel family protein|nr:VWA domain-containing protein [Halieaceae bacterium]
MNELLTHFHFLRPYWLWGAVPALLLLLLLWRQLRSGKAWSSIIAADLLPYLLSDGEQRRVTRLPLWSLLLAWMLAVLALAGPSWERLPQPVERRENALVVLYDLSLSMNATDISPSRLIRSRQKLLDLLELKTEGTTALVAYAGDAHVVSPLTDDLRTVANLLPALSPEIMPVKGSRPARAVEQALRLLRDSGLEHGQILLVTDGIHNNDADDIADLMEGSLYRLSVLGVGTAEGGPIPTDSGFLRDDGGSIVIAGLDRPPLQQLAERFGGSYSDLELSDRDIQRILNTDLWDDSETQRVLDRSVDTWSDRGYWLALALLPIALGAFRRGWLLVLLLLPVADPVQAQDWQQWFMNRDQRGQALLQAGEAEAAAKTFRDADWSAAANYRAGDYEAALQHYRNLDTADGWYNRGNALARAGELQDAIGAYEKALEQSPDMEDARFNKQLLEQLLQQQNQQQENQQQENQQQQNDQQQDNQQQQGDSQEQQKGNDSNDPQQQPQDARQSQDQRDGDESGQDSQPPAEPRQQEGESEPRQDENKDASQRPEQQPGEKPQGEDDSAPPAQANPEEDAGERERDMANEQWLRRIPDDPSGLLRRKFQYESRMRQREGGLDSNGNPIEDDDATRW